MDLFCLLTGLFNIGNKLLVSIDLFLKIRANLKLGLPPSQVARTLLDHVPNHPGKHCGLLWDHNDAATIIVQFSPFEWHFYHFCLLSSCVFVFASVHVLNPDESSQIQELLLSGYWAFECLTVRDYNDMICGICGVAPKLEIAQRYTKNVLELKNVEVTDSDQKIVIKTLIELFGSDNVLFFSVVYMA